MDRVCLQYIESSAGSATRLALRLGLVARPIDIHRFPDGELRVTAAAAAETTIIHASLDQPNEKLISLLLAAEALHRNGTTRLILLAPYLCYMRQDAAFHRNEALSQKVVGELLSGTFDRVITIDAHLHRTKDIRSIFKSIEAENLSAAPAIASYLQGLPLDPATVVFGPDEESRNWVRNLAGRLGLDFAVAEKTRDGDQSVRITLPDREFRGRPALLVDDIVSSGGTLMACSRALRSAGVEAIDAVVTHALFPASRIGEFVQAGIRSIRSTDSVQHPTNVVFLDSTLADALRNEFGEGVEKGSSS